VKALSIGTCAGSSGLAVTVLSTANGLPMSTRPLTSRFSP
jgi:hypothetical protein